MNIVWNGFSNLLERRLMFNLNWMLFLNSLKEINFKSGPFFPGGHHQDLEDAEKDFQRTAAVRAGWDLEKHVPALQKDDQRADRVADRTQVHEERRGQYQPVHLHGLKTTHLILPLFGHIIRPLGKTWQSVKKQRVKFWTHSWAIQLFHLHTK